MYKMISKSELRKAFCLVMVSCTLHYAGIILTIIPSLSIQSVIADKEKDKMKQKGIVSC